MDMEVLIKSTKLHVIMATILAFFRLSNYFQPIHMVKK